MKYKAVHFIALFLLMLITGVFWGTWFTLTRKLADFSPEEFIHIGQTIIKNVAVPMRIIMPCGIVFMAVALWLSRNKKSTPYYLGLFSLVLIVSVLLVTLMILVPIDNKIREWTVATIPPDWTSYRTTWDLFHTVRTFASLASFACFSFFILEEKG